MKKINWGYGIIIAFALFISFILYFVIKVQTNSKYDNELVDTDYYKKELDYSNYMQKKQNAINLENKVQILKNQNGVEINFPPDFDYKKISGKISLYRPSNQKLDCEIPISLSSTKLLIPKNILIDGLWDITIEWEYNQKKYINTESLKM